MCQYAVFVNMASNMARLSSLSNCSLLEEAAGGSLHPWLKVYRKQQHWVYRCIVSNNIGCIYTRVYQGLWLM